MNNVEAGIIGIVISILTYALFCDIPMEYLPSFLIALWVIIFVISIILVVIGENHEHY